MSLFVNLERCVVPVHVCAVFALKKSSKQTQNSLNPARKVGEQCRFVGNQENWGKKGVERGPVMVMQGKVKIQSPLVTQLWFCSNWINYPRIQK